jgi:OmpA-OmpF porin, OOP family
MKESYLKTFLLVVGALMLVSCAAPQAVPPFTPQNLNPLIQSGEYIPKVENFVVIMDKSGSMGQICKGEQKLDMAKRLAARLNHTIPDLKLTGALRVFGRTAVFDNQLTKLFWGPAPYSKGALDDGLNKIGFSRGDSPLDQAFDATGQDFKAAQGTIAVIVFTDANKHYMIYDKVKKSTADLKAQYGDRLCIYAVQIGDDKEGKELLEQVVQMGQCGCYANAADIASSEGMADFVKKVFLKKAPPKPVKVVEKVVIMDSDGDGVPDNLDKCPGTPKGARVNADGCWVIDNVLFDFDKSIVKPQFYPVLDEVARVFEMNPGLRVRLEGHTDSIGTPQYNMGLSLRRAKAVEAYLVNKGIAKERIYAEGFGLTRPIASNATKEGRALNRRVQLTPVP